MGEFRPDHLVLHDYGGSPKNEDGVFNPYHTLVFPDGSKRYRNPGNPYGDKAPHAYKFNPQSLGLSYAGQVGSKPTPEAMRTLRGEMDAIKKQFPGINVLSHGEAYARTRGTSEQASRDGRGLDEASWRHTIGNDEYATGPAAPAQPTQFNNGGVVSSMPLNGPASGGIDYKSRSLVAGHPGGLTPVSAPYQSDHQRRSAPAFDEPDQTPQQPNIEQNPSSLHPWMRPQRVSGQSGEAKNPNMNAVAPSMPLGENEEFSNPYFEPRGFSQYPLNAEAEKSQHFTPGPANPPDAMPLNASGSWQRFTPNPGPAKPDASVPGLIQAPYQAPRPQQAPYTVAAAPTVDPTTTGQQAPYQQPAPQQQMTAPFYSQPAQVAPPRQQTAQVNQTEPSTDRMSLGGPKPVSGPAAGGFKGAQWVHGGGQPGIRWGNGDFTWTKS